MLNVSRLFLMTATVLAASSTTALATVESHKIAAGDGAAEDEFGYVVAVDQGVVAVGAPDDDDNGLGSGSAYLYNAATGIQIAKLTASDGAAGDAFGFSVALGGGLVAVGAVRDNHNGVASGSAYLFDASTGSQLAKLTPSDGAAGDEFGFAVALDGGVVAVGAKRDDDNGADSGSVYLFSAATGLQLGKLVANDAAANDNFGEAVALDGGIVAIGAHGDWDNGPLSGSAYLFDVATGTQLRKLLANDGASNDFFGSAIDIDNGVVAVGAWAKSVVFDHSGAAYTFDAATGVQIARLVPSDAHDRDNFGRTVSIDNGVVAIGAHQDDDNGFNSGSAYLFEGLANIQLDKLLASDGAVGDLFGSSVAIANGVVVVGAIGDDDNGSDSGSVYLFGPSGADLFRRGDCNDDGSFNLADAVTVLGILFVSGAPLLPNCADACDANDDGSLDISDPVTMLSALFGTGSGPLPSPGSDTCGSDSTADSFACQPVTCP